MFQMLSYFDLKPGVSAADYAHSVAVLAEHLAAQDLIIRIGPLGRRQRNTILDTDDERLQSYFLMMYFRDKAQSDLAIDYIESLAEPGASLHQQMYNKIDNAMFVCWEDVD
ncbi:MAG: DUF6614 family protein [Pseudomonadota bacterium]